VLGLGADARMLGGGGGRWLDCGVCVAEPSSPAGRERTGGGGGPPERDGGGGGWGTPNGGVLVIGDVVGVVCVSGAATGGALGVGTSGGGVGEIPGSVVRGT